MTHPEVKATNEAVNRRTQARLLERLEARQVGDDARGVFSFAILGGCAFSVIAIGLAIAYLIFRFAASL